MQRNRDESAKVLFTILFGWFIAFCQFIGMVGIASFFVGAMVQAVMKANGIYNSPYPDIVTAIIFVGLSIAVAVSWYRKQCLIRREREL